MSAFPEKKACETASNSGMVRRGVGVSGGGVDGGNRGDCGTGVRASISKPTPSSEMLTYSYTAL